MNVWIVIAAYREEHSIGSVVKELVDAGYKNVVVVDDGSDDATSRVAKKYTPHVLRHVINRGQGASLKTGIDYALENDADIIVTFDADGQHRVEDIPALIKPVKSGDADIAVGSRFLRPGSNVPFFRKLLLKGGAFLIWVLYGIKLTDSHNGFRALSRQAAEDIEITMDRMEHASEILSEIKKKNLRYVEVPVVIRYTQYSMEHGQSSWNAIKIFYRTLKHRLTK
ncbi:MAG TPA: glycosyltransferase family 2 protein [Candidatus Nanoarchaeia archaeon]|nr:glycosyltransferase family 2 protein [Candidatus Nanoarchaeia archaeon]